jgi:hypothetical protein
MWQKLNAIYSCIISEQIRMQLHCVCKICKCPAMVLFPNFCKVCAPFWNFGARTLGFDRYLKHIVKKKLAETYILVPRQPRTIMCHLKSGCSVGQRHGFSVPVGEDSGTSWATNHPCPKRIEASLAVPCNHCKTLLRYNSNIKWTNISLSWINNHLAHQISYPRLNSGQIL